VTIVSINLYYAAVKVDVYRLALWKAELTFINYIVEIIYINNAIVKPRTAGGSKVTTPPFFLNNFGSRRHLEVRFHQFLGVYSSDNYAHYGGSPIEKFPVVTLWRPLQQMSVETILNKFRNKKGN